jgi:4-hydroxyphenylacetate 3-monooxygenase
LLPLGPGQEKESITCAVPVNAPGLSLWSRKPFERYAVTQFDNPLSSRFDETDSMVIFEDVKVPWEKVFTHDQVDHSREIYILTAGHCFGNHQSNVRFWSKLRLLVGLASRLAQAGSVSEVPAVRETLGRLAAMEAALAGMIYGQCEDYETLPNGYVCFNRRYMYAALNWCQENYVPICTTVRELCGGSVFQMPADISVVNDPKLRQTFDDYWSTPTHTAVERMKLYKLAWDLLGSEFGSRHLQYENFYAGPSFIVRNHSFRECNWEQFHKIVDDLLASYDVPAEYSAAMRQ